MLCIHHNDLDGLCSAAIVALANDRDQINFHQMDYRDTLPMTIFKEGEKVYVVDFSLPPKAMEELVKKSGDVVWIDHHATAARYPYQDLPGLRNFDNKAFAACELVWKYFYADARLPDSIRYIGDYDKWALRYQPKCFEYYEGAKTLSGIDVPNSLVWRGLLENNERTKEILEAGRSCIKYRNAYALLMRTSHGYKTSIDGEEAIALNVYGFGSMIFGEAFNMYPVCIAYVHDGEKFTVSLYSTTVDVSKIAKKFGGGGHKNAAGMTLSNEQFMKLIGKKNEGNL